jgi:hypothetical protein
VKREIRHPKPKNVEELLEEGVHKMIEKKEMELKKLKEFWYGPSTK